MGRDGKGGGDIDVGGDDEGEGGGVTNGVDCRAGGGCIVEVTVVVMEEVATMTMVEGSVAGGSGGCD